MDVFALKRATDASSESLDGVRIHRLNVQRHQGAGLSVYLREYATFLALASVSLASAHRTRRYGLVHVHSLPDFLVLAAVPLRLVGIPVLLDLHEAMPEFFAMRFPRRSRGMMFHAVRFQERMSIAAASFVITANQALADRLTGLGTAADKIAVVPNSPSLARFDAGIYPTRTFMEDGVLRLIYAGALTPVYELEVVVAAIAEARVRRPSLEIVLDIYGRGDSESSIRHSAAALGLERVVRLHGRIPLEEVPGRVAAADVGLAPTRLDRFTALSLSTKVFEYAAMARPVIASRLPLIEGTFGRDSVATYESGDPVDLATAILEIVDNPDRRRERVARSQAVAQGSAWEHSAPVFQSIVDRIATDADGRQ